MKKNILLSVLGTMILLVLSIGIFHYYHPTHYAYNDRFVIGNTREKIVERYGKFDHIRANQEGEITCGTYMIHDNTPELFMGYDDSLWYEIYFEDGVATKVKLREGYIGG